MITFDSAGPADTRAFGRRVGEAVRPGDILSLEGDLGAGKTEFVKGLAEGLKVSDAAGVTSPTFVFQNVYPGSVPLCHFDLYRIAPGQDPDALGLDDTGEGVVAIEWGDRVPPERLGPHIRIRFEIRSETARRLEIEGVGFSLERLNLQG